MQHSKSLGSFALSHDSTSEAQQVQPPRPRSSLDTFVIPGRTRIPSSKPEPIDIEITKGLLNPNMVLPPPPPPHEATGGYHHVQKRSKSPGPRMGDRSHHQAHQSAHPVLYKVRPEISTRPPPRIGGRDSIFVPHRRPPLSVYQGQPENEAADQANELRHIPTATFDGANDSGKESPATSWSNVSKRILTDSSTSSRGMYGPQFLEEYNRLAKTHGLPELVVETGDGDDQVKTKSKTHHHGWLARKFFHRSSSTYTLQAKTTYKPITRKKSLRRIPSLSNASHANILKDKTLEETSRLGGLSVVILPAGFAVDKLTIPTCLSVTLAFLLEQGCNTPGIFRISGQSSTVTALYDHYALKYARRDAGSPSKIQETVGSGLLPTDIEYTVHDVASLFKKILIGLPGGLLGSLELFEAIRGIFLRLQDAPELSADQMTKVRAKLIALAILSSPSSYRVHLIQAVLGLVSYFGHEAARMLAEGIVPAEAPQPGQASGLMTCQSLGVVLGPLLLGNLTDSVDVSPENTEDGPPKSNDGSKKTKKQKRASTTNKLTQDAALSAHVDRANLTANIMELLLISWREVVEALRVTQGINNASMRLRSGSQTKKVARHPGSRLTLVGSEEERLWDVLRGGTLPSRLNGPVQVKRSMRMSSRSAMPRGLIDVSEDSQQTRCSGATGSEGNAVERSDQNILDSARKSSVRLVGSTPTTPEEEDDIAEVSEPGLHEGQKSCSDAAMEQMAMGTILPPRERTPSTTPKHKQSRRTPSKQSSGRKGHRRSWSRPTPETAVKSHSRSATDPQEAIEDFQPTKSKRPLLMGDAYKTRRSTSSYSKESHSEQMPTYPVRQSSLPSDKQLDLDENRRSDTSYIAPPKREAPQFPEKERSVRRSSGTIDYERHPSDTARRNSVRLMARRLNDTSAATHNDTLTTTTSPPVHTSIIPSPTLRMEDPFISLPGALSEKETLIPKPVTEAGRARKADSRSTSRSPSPPKMISPKSYLKKGSSILNVVPDQDAELVRWNSVPRQNSTRRHNLAPQNDSFPRASISSTARRDSGQREGSDSFIIKRQDSFRLLNPVSTRPLSAYSEESLRRMQASVEEPLLAHHIPTRVIPIDPSTNVRVDVSYESQSTDAPEASATLSRSSSVLNTSNTITPLQRQGSHNATLYSEITRLKRQLEQRTEEVQAAKRQLDAARMGTKSTPGGSTVSKGTLSDQVKHAKKEAGFWRNRAQYAEKELRGMRELAYHVSEIRDQESDEGREGGSKGKSFGGDGRGLERRSSKVWSPEWNMAL